MYYPFIKSPEIIKKLLKALDCGVRKPDPHKSAGSHLRGLKPPLIVLNRNFCRQAITFCIDSDYPTEVGVQDYVSIFFDRRQDLMVLAV